MRLATSVVEADDCFQETFLKLLSRMSEKNRVAYVLLKEENLSAREAAAVLGTTVDAVKQRAHRAYQSLKSALSTAGWSEYGNPV